MYTMKKDFENIMGKKENVFLLFVSNQKQNTLMCINNSFNKGEHDMKIG